jgi:hypothetical protein
MSRRQASSAVHVRSCCASDRSEREPRSKITGGPVSCKCHAHAAKRVSPRQMARTRPLRAPACRRRSSIDQPSAGANRSELTCGARPRGVVFSFEAAHKVTEAP